MIPERYQNESDTIKQLFEWGHPQAREGYYSCREWEDYLAYGFKQEDYLSLIPLMTDDELLNKSMGNKERWVPVYAWRILGQLRCEWAALILLPTLKRYQHSKVARDELPVVIGMIGLSIDKLAKIVLNESQHESCLLRESALDGLYETAKHHPELANLVQDCLAEFQQAAAKSEQDYWLISQFGESDTSNELLEKAKLIDWELLQREYRESMKPKVSNRPGAGRNNLCPCSSGKRFKHCCSP